MSCKSAIEEKQVKGTSAFKIVVGDKALPLDQTINAYYETLMWLESAAADLNYQVHEIEERLGGA